MDFDADSPIENFPDDRFAFGAFARGLAKQILGYDRPTSFVIGINGAWGMGKTSLLRLLERALEEDTEHSVPIVVRYSPWLVRNRDSLLRDLLPELAEKLQQRSGTHQVRARLRKAKAALNRYARAVRGVELGLSVATATATIASIPLAPVFAPLATLAGLAGKILGHASPRATLEELRREAQIAFKAAQVRVVLIIDDLDRLEPSEILDMTRVVRSTLDLPHLAFVIAYDRQRVAESIEQSLGIDGEAYLEKIVQLPVSVPDCNDFDLARAFAERVSPVLGEMSDAQTNRLAAFVWQDFRTSFLKTPRDVARVANAVSFAWRGLRAEVDPGDLVAMSALRVKAPTVFAWCLDYCTAYYKERMRGFLKDEYVRRYKAKLDAACQADGLNADDFGSTLRILPGIARGGLKREFLLFESIDVDSTHQAAREKRLSSEQHWQAYFDLSPGRNGLSEAQFAVFVSQAETDRSAAVTALLEAAQKKEATGASAALRLIDRVRAEAKGTSLSESARIALFNVVADAADRVSDIIGPPTFFDLPLFAVLRWTTEALLRPLSEEARSSCIENAVKQRESICWLSQLIRDELFEHGRLGDNSDRGRKPWLGSTNLDAACLSALDRIRDLAAQGALMGVLDLGSPLSLWRDAGPGGEAKSWVVKITKPDDSLVSFVHALKQRVNSTAGDFWRVDRRFFSDFLEYDDALSRLREIARSTSDASLRARASEAIRMLTRER